MSKPIIAVLGQSNGGSVRVSELFYTLSQNTEHARLMGFTVGGTAISANDDQDWNINSRDELFDSAVAQIREATAEGDHFAGLIWVQGEADAVLPGASSYYESNLTNLINALQVEFGQFKTSIVALSYQAPFIKNIRPEYRDEWMEVRAAQFNLGRDRTDIYTVNPDAIAKSYGLTPDLMFRDADKHYTSQFAGILLRASLKFVDPDNLLCDTGEIRGTEESETIYGLSTSDVIVGLGGDDILLGANGHDLIVGNTGADRLYGQIGNDTIVGGFGDTIVGGNGSDKFVFTKGFTRATILDLEEKDVLVMNNYPTDDFSIRQSGRNTIITLDGDMLLLANTQANTINKADFDF